MNQRRYLGGPGSHGHHGGALLGNTGGRGVPSRPGGYGNALSNRGAHGMYRGPARPNFQGNPGQRMIPGQNHISKKYNK